MSTLYTPVPAGLAFANPADNNYLLRRILNVLQNGAPGIGPVVDDNTLLRQILAVLEGDAGAGGVGVSYSLPAAYSVAALQAVPTVGTIPLGAIVNVVGAVSPGQLNTYQLQAGALPTNSPSYFPPNDNPNAHWMLVA